MFKNAQRIPFLWWILVVWVAITVGGVSAGSIWGLGLHCEATIPNGEFPCFGPVDPNAAELVISAFLGAFRLGIGYGVVAGLPAVIFAVAVTVVGWVFRKVVDRRSALWPSVTLAVGTGVATVLLMRSDQVGTLYSWVGLCVFLAVVAGSIRATSRQWNLAESNQRAAT